jgi:hypothetical protein
MSLSQGRIPPARGRTFRPQRIPLANVKAARPHQHHVDTRRLFWLLGAVPLFTGMFLSLTDFFLGVPFIALGWFVMVGLPGALVALRHPWAAAMLRTLRQEYRHPRLFGLAQAWLCFLVPGWLSINVSPFRYPLAFISVELFVVVTAVLFVVGFGPLAGIWLFDRRR